MNFIGKYAKVASFTFGLVGIANLSTTLYKEEQRQRFFKHPELYSVGILTKSIYFGALWPAFYINAFFTPKDAFLFRYNIEETMDELRKSLEDSPK